MLSGRLLMVLLETRVTKHIGIVGVSPEGAALFVRQISRQAAQCLAPRDHPHISLHNGPLAEYIDAINDDDWQRVGDLLRRSAKILADAGADFVLTPDNAVQYAIPLAEHESPLPWLAMPDLVADAIIADGRETVGLIGTRWVTRGSAYQTQLGMRGIRVVAPDDADADRLERVILDELVYGQIRTESQQIMLDSISRLADRGCSGVILGCSEAPLVISEANSPLPVYDAADILARQAVQRARAAAPG